MYANLRYVGGCGGGAAHLLVDRSLGRCGSHYKKPHLEIRNSKIKHICFHSKYEAKLRKTVFFVALVEFLFPTNSGVP